MSIKDYENANWKFEIGDNVKFCSDLAQGWVGEVTGRYLYYIDNPPRNRYNLLITGIVPEVNLGKLRTDDVHESEIEKRI